MYKAILNIDIKKVQTDLRLGLNPNAWTETSDILRYVAAEDDGLSAHPRLSLLMVATLTNKPKLIKALIESGAQIDQQDDNGTTALLLACRMGFYRAARCLVLSGADAGLQDYGGNTPLMEACDLQIPDSLFADIGESVKGKYKIINFLLKRRVELNIQNTKGETALHILCDDLCGDELSLVKKLMKLKANPNVFDHEANTPLINGVLSDCLDMDKTISFYRFMVDHDADPSLLDQYRQNTFDVLEDSFFDDETLGYFKSYYEKKVLSKAVNSNEHEHTTSLLKM